MINILSTVSMHFRNSACASTYTLYSSAQTFNRLFNIRVNNFPTVLKSVMLVLMIVESAFYKLHTKYLTMLQLS